MICVGIDVAKDKHDSFIMNSDGEVLADIFTVSNSKEGFEHLLQTINTCTGIGGSKIKVGLEATGHYSYNLLGFLLDNDLPTFVINPLHTNLYRKSLSFRKTKTDKIDARMIASMLMSDVSLKPYTTHLVNLLYTASKGRYNRDKAIQIRDAARNSIGTYMPAKSLELKHTIKLIKELDAEIAEIELAIKEIMDTIDSPITSIPGIGLSMAAIIIAEIGDFNNFDSPDKILAFFGLSPSTYQSGKLNNCYAHMEKRGSRYLRYALFNSTKFVCNWCPLFAEYLAKKRSEGKHYNVAISHAAKKLVRLIFDLQKSGQLYSVKS